MGASGFDVTFVHPKSACGVLLELVQAPADVIEAYKAAANAKLILLFQSFVLKLFF